MWEINFGPKLIFRISLGAKRKSSSNQWPKRKLRKKGTNGTRMPVRSSKSDWKRRKKRLESRGPARN